MAEARDGQSKAKKPVIEVITTVFERVNRHIMEHPPGYYGSDGEIYDEVGYNANPGNFMRTDILVHSKHLSK